MPLKATEVSTMMSSSSQRGQGMEDGAEAGEQRSEDGEHDAGEHGLDGSGEVEAHDELKPRDGRDEIALVHAARLVVDVEHAAADHDGDIHGERDGAGEQKLHVLDVGIELDDLQHDLLHDFGLNGGSVERIDERLHLGLDAAADELVGVIDDHAQFGRVAGEHAARILRGDDDDAGELAGAHIFDGLALVAVLSGGEGADVGGDGVEGLVHFDGLDAVVVVDDADGGVADFSAECVSEDDELHQRQHHRRTA